MNQVAILHRKSKHYPEKVVCGVFKYADVNITERAMDQWKVVFVWKFPEFRDAEFTVEWTEFFPASGVC